MYAAPINTVSTHATRSSSLAINRTCGWASSTSSAIRHVLTDEGGRRRRRRLMSSHPAAS